MKPFKFALRIWITISSVLVFLTSWSLLGHSPKPIDTRLSVATPLPTLEPLPSFNQQSNHDGFGSLVFQQMPRSRRSMFFVTGGS